MDLYGHCVSDILQMQQIELGKSCVQTFISKSLEKVLRELGEEILWQPC